MDVPHERFEALKRTAHESIRANDGVRQAKGNGRRKSTAGNGRPLATPPYLIKNGSLVAILLAIWLRTP